LAKSIQGIKMVHSSYIFPGHTCNGNGTLGTFYPHLHHKELFLTRFPQESKLMWTDSVHVCNFHVLSPHLITWDSLGQFSPICRRAKVTKSLNPYKLCGN